MRNSGFGVQEIVKHLQDKGVRVSRWALYRLFDKYTSIRSVADLKRRARQQILDEAHYRFIDNTIVDNVDMTSRELHTALISEYPKLEPLSLSTVKRAYRRLGWESKKKTRYCALISERTKKSVLNFVLSVAMTFSFWTSSGQMNAQYS